ncbi:unnamed protein product [Spodoptera exigua]|nr:unnamed protein product [Spodoptera exigua]
MSANEHTDYLMAADGEPRTAHPPPHGSLEPMQSRDCECEYTMCEYRAGLETGWFLISKNLTASSRPARECRCQEIWNRIVAEYAMVRHLHTIGYPVRHFPRANKFMNTSFTFLDPYINDIKDSDIPHNIYDIYRKRFSITGSIMKANCSVAAGPSSGRNNSALASGTPETGKSEAAGTISASGAVATAGPSGPPNKSSALGTESGSRATQSNAPAKSSTSAKSSASGKTDKPKVGLSPTSDAKKSASHSKSGKSDCKSKSGVFRPTGPHFTTRFTPAVYAVVCGSRCTGGQLVESRGPRLPAASAGGTRALCDRLASDRGGRRVFCEATLTTGVRTALCSSSVDSRLRWMTIPDADDSNVRECRQKYLLSIIVTVKRLSSNYTELLDWQISHQT